jgi:hypothetical protein
MTRPRQRLRAMKKPARKTAAREVEVRHILARLQGCL